MTVAKAIVQLVMTILAALLPVLTVGPLDAAAWVNVVILAAGVVMVYNASNAIPGYGWAKMIASAVSAIAVVLAAALTSGTGLNAVDYIQMILAAAATLGVGAVPNSSVPAPAQA